MAPRTLKFSDMTKLIVFSDLHMTVKGDPIIGIDPYARLMNGIRHVNKFHRDAALVVFLGDLAHFANRPTYVRLKRALDQLRVAPRPDARQPRRS